MRSLEIRTERIFNNLIKQNQKLAADFVLKQSKIVSSAQSPTSSVKSPEYSALSPASSVQSSVSIVQLPEFSVQGSESRVQRLTLASRAQEFRYAVVEFEFKHSNINKGISPYIVKMRKQKLPQFAEFFYYFSCYIKVSDGQQ